MFNNIGEKVKLLAKIQFWLIVVLGAVLIVNVWLVQKSITALYAIIDFALLPIVAYIASYLLYAFGDLVDNVAALRKHFIIPTVETKTDAPAAAVSDDMPIKCPNCGTLNKAGSDCCWLCKKPLA